MTTTFLIKRGRRTRYRQARAHIARFDNMGNIAGSWCGARYDVSSNVPWGLRQCQHCLRQIRRWEDSR